MATLLLPLHRCCQRSALLLVARRQMSSSSSSPSSLLSRLLTFLANRFYDVEFLLIRKEKMHKNKIRRKNVYFAFAQSLYGTNSASAYFILSSGGGFRFVGHSDWVRANKKGKFSWDFLKHKESTIEEVDMSRTIINHRGLSNLATQPTLRTLKLQGCPEVDDWFLARLHFFQDSLEELDISECPRVTAGGLPSLKNLKRLKRLNVSSLPRLSNPALMVILLEEMLPQCQITADNYNFSLGQVEGECAEVELRQRSSIEGGTRVGPEP
ncbi:ATP synthase subunit s-like protein isoform X2 [Austrofundulus limnaeus]|uniref:Distal membrane-arm assembly complex protein 2 n=1 Tax=Austrofundulus limnaeus TaxID=52670 RepID=A0A2I4BRV3_AUSLI|nr:PREDICTED: ATP synthase subunit s-like protein isoform X2 [Austrofundulus limnaeus]